MNVFAALLYLLTGLIPTMIAYWLIGLIVVAIVRRIRGQPFDGAPTIAFRYTWPLAALWIFYDFYSHILVH